MRRVSSGQEPYSLAMLLHEHFPELATWYVRILLPTCPGDVGPGPPGRYNQFEVNRGLPDTLLGAVLPAPWAGVERC